MSEDNYSGDPKTVKYNGDVLLLKRNGWISAIAWTLTLVNPCYMTRQVHELGKEQYEIRVNITSLKPLRTEKHSSL